MNALSSGSLSRVTEAVWVQHSDRTLGVEDKPFGDGRVECSLHQRRRTCQNGATHSLQSSWDTALSNLSLQIRLGRPRHCSMPQSPDSAILPLLALLSSVQLPLGLDREKRILLELEQNASHSKTQAVVAFVTIWLNQPTALQ